jgi:hypothetical protein
VKGDGGEGADGSLGVGVVVGDSGGLTAAPQRGVGSKVKDHARYQGIRHIRRFQINQ